MSQKDPRIDTYIEQAQAFAQPVLKHLRKLIHQAVPEVQETIKWGMPSFDYKGTFCSMAAFKGHMTFGFWKYKLMQDPHGYLQERANQGGEAMGNLGRITCKKDLPPDEIILDLLMQAKKLNDEGIKVVKEKKAAKPALPIPDYLKTALEKNKNALTNFHSFSPSARNEYIDWLEEAKTETTRNKRLEQAIEWISENKKRNWKYEKSC